MRFLLLVLLFAVAGTLAWRVLGFRAGRPPRDSQPDTEPAPLPESQTSTAPTSPGLPSTGSHGAAPNTHGLPERTSSVRVIPPPASPAVAPAAGSASVGASVTAVVPPSTRGLDDPDAVRPELDDAVVSSARTLVTPAVPDEVLTDALLDATPEQLQHLLAAVPQDVMAHALGDDVQQSHAPLAASEKAQLDGLGDALDDLDIWDFASDAAPGDNANGANTSGHKA